MVKYFLKEGNMTEMNQIYKCEICGNIVEILHEGAGQLVCCGKPMNLFESKTADTSTEKHVPFIEVKDGTVIVRVGENQNHPMEENHYIEWIELIADGVIMKKFLKPGDKPKAVFVTDAKNLSAREYCNLHGLWEK